MRAPIQSDHIVHFFDDERARIETVSQFLAAAMNSHASALVIARRHHWDAIRAALAAQGAVPEPPARLVVLDAEHVAHQLLRGDAVEPALFEKVLTTVVRDLAATSRQPVVAYGEVVDILALERNFAAAVRLEACWNDLAARESMTLLCGYASAHFAIGDRAALAAVCAAHARVHTDSPDALGHWLVAAAVNPTA